MFTILARRGGCAQTSLAFGHSPGESAGREGDGNAPVPDLGRQFRCACIESYGMIKIIHIRRTFAGKRIQDCASQKGGRKTMNEMTKQGREAVSLTAWNVCQVSILIASSKDICCRYGLFVKVWENSAGLLHPAGLKGYNDRILPFIGKSSRRHGFGKQRTAGCDCGGHPPILFIFRRFCHGF